MSPGSRPGVETAPRAETADALTAGAISVCHVASGDRWAGAEVQVATLLRALARRPELRLSAILLNEGRLAEEARKCGVAVKVIPEAQNWFPAILAQATRHLRGQGIQVLHSHRYKENLLAALLAWRCGVPHVVRSQHGMPEPFRGWKRLKQGGLQWLDRMTARHATDRVIAVTVEMSAWLGRHTRPGQVVTIHNGLDREQAQSRLNAQQAKQRLGIPADGSVIGTAGRLEPIKRLDLFLLAAAQIAQAAGGARFVIVGEGSEETRLRELARAQGLGERALFLGHRDDIYDVLRALDLFVISSDHEGLPMVLLEAMNLGVPVVSRAVGGICEVIENHVSGVLVDSVEPAALARACLDLLADEGARRRLAAAGPQRVAERFSAEKTAAQVADLYRSLVEQDRGKRA